MRKDKEIERQTINEKIDAFLKKGGKIKEIPQGISGSTKSTHMILPINHFQRLSTSEVQKAKEDKSK